MNETPLPAPRHLESAIELTMFHILADQDLFQRRSWYQSLDAVTCAYETDVLILLDARPRTAEQILAAFSRVRSHAAQKYPAEVKRVAPELLWLINEANG